MEFLLLLLNINIYLVKFQFTIHVSNVRVFKVALCPIILTLHSQMYKSDIKIYSYWFMVYHSKGQS